MTFRKFLFALIFISFYNVCEAQFENTKWSGKLMVPTEADCYFHFKKDSLILYLVEGDYEIEVMNYTVSKDTIKILKLHGGSPCNDDVLGIYTWKMENEKLKLSTVNDECMERSSAFKDTDLRLMKAVEAVKPKE